MNDSARTTEQLGLLLMMVRWIIYASWWAPIFFIFAYWVPQFDSIFTMLSEKGELPTLTAWLLSWSQLNKTTFYLPAFFVLLIFFAVDWLFMRLGRSTEKNICPWLWLMGISIGSIVAVLLVLLALTLPIFRMSEPVH